MLKLVQPVALADLPLTEKRKIIAQRIRERQQRELQEAQSLQQMYAELFPGSSVGPMATTEELEEALLISAGVCHEGFLPNMQGIFAEIGERTGRVPRWAKVNAGAHIPKRLSAAMPKLAKTALCQELSEGGMMSSLDQAEMCSHSPATFAKVASRHLGIVRQQRMTATALKVVSKDLEATKLRVLELEAKGSSTEEWVAKAVELRRAHRPWTEIVSIVHKRRADVIRAVEAAMSLETHQK